MFSVKHQPESPMSPPSPSHPSRLSQSSFQFPERSHFLTEKHRWDSFWGGVRAVLSTYCCETNESKQWQRTRNITSVSVESGIQELGHSGVGPLRRLQSGQWWRPWLSGGCLRQEATHFHVGWLTWVLAGGRLTSPRLSTGLPEHPHDLAAGPWASGMN